MVHQDKRARSLPQIYRQVLERLKSEKVYYPLEEYLGAYSFLLTCHQPYRRDKAGVLVLVGPPGSGKTNMLQHSAGSARVMIVRFSLADCESSGAGDPASKLQQAAIQAEKFEQAGIPVVIVIEDFELGMACPQNGEGSSTNRPQIQGVLQELLDGTHSIGGRVLTPKRFAFTSNDLTAVRSSMVREGRAIVIEYNPDRREKSRIAQAVLSGILPPRVLRRELKRLSHLTVAEIVAVKAELRQQAEQLITFDLPWPAYEAWLTSKRTTTLIDAVVARLMNHRDVSQAIFRVRKRAGSRRSYL